MLFLFVFLKNINYILIKNIIKNNYYLFNLYNWQKLIILCYLII